MKLKPIHGFDYFLVLLSRKVKIYTPEGKVIPLMEIAKTPFGQVKIIMDIGGYCEKVEEKYNKNAWLHKRVGVID